MEQHSLHRKLATFFLLNGVILSGILTAAAILLLRWNLIVRGEASSVFSAIYYYLLKFHQGEDSWRPMLEALRCYELNLPIYDTVFFLQKTKFQYPLSSLIPMQVMRWFGWSDQTMLVAFNAATWIAFWLTIAVSFAILVESIRRNLPEQDLTRKNLALLAVVVTLSGVCFYPLLKNYVLGQVQAFISLMFATALYLWLKNRQTASGALLGLMCLIKPQYGLFLIWLALRKKFRALTASGIVLAIGCLIVAAVFGWREQLRYLDVLSFMGRHGESFWPNESINGLMNRMLFNGANLHWEAHSFAPYNGMIHAATLISSGCLIIAALVLPMLRSKIGSAVDFSIMAVTITVASPIAWEHHYGILFPIFALVVAGAAGERRWGWLAAAYILCSNSWSPFNALAGVPALNALQSLRLFGVFLLIGFLYRICGERLAVPRTEEPSRLLTSSPAT